MTAAYCAQNIRLWREIGVTADHHVSAQSRADISWLPQAPGTVSVGLCCLAAFGAGERLALD
jgi:hypothetical protein